MRWNEFRLQRFFQHQLPGVIGLVLVPLGSVGAVSLPLEGRESQPWVVSSGGSRSQLQQRSPVRTGQTSPRPTPANRFDAELLRLTNVERQRAGLRPLRLSPQLAQAAQRHAEDMVRNRFFSHTGSNGSSISDRVRSAGYRFSSTGENIAAGAATPEATIRQWMQSPGHRRNILNPSYTEIGFGYVNAPGDRYRHYWVQVFGTPQTRS